ncbi:AGE family epimerase/isomerase [Robbsia andropogonis]|uniref:AGE family epimerase/isomerase n=1 Tax=Robbsia andropogonis TaxID=28092 RepID=UPI003D25FF9C
MPDFRAPPFLRAHIRDTLGFYAPHGYDASGGFHHAFRDDRTVFDAETRHLVSSCRFVFNYATAYRAFGDKADQARALHAMRFVRDVHRDPVRGGYDWTMKWRPGTSGAQPMKTEVDATRHAYGHAFVLLAYAHASLAGIQEATPLIAETYALVNTHFWDSTHQLYADEADGDWHLQPYRGQNANMHMTEALMAAYDATKERHYLIRALLLAENICIRQAALTNDLIWEHFDSDWHVDWEYNKNDPANLFRPWGFQLGHQVEWTKILLQLERRVNAIPELTPQTMWMLPRARELYDAAMVPGWDTQHGGILFGMAPDGTICDNDKYFWVQAEAFAAAARLARRTGEQRYWEDYDRLWAYCWEHFIDHTYGAWYRILRRDNTKYSDEKSPPGKTDYHTMGACHDVLAALDEVSVQARNG